MDEVEGAKTFAVEGATYDRFMGRYSVQLAPLFADAAGVTPGQSACDVGCGPGALTGELVRRLGADAVVACDPSPGFVADCARRNPGVRVELGRAESIPFESAQFDHAMAQLVLHFVSDAPAAIAEMARVARPGGVVSACVWDFDNGMELLRGFWDAAGVIDPDAPARAGTLRFGKPGELAELFTGAGLTDVEESTLRVSTAYTDFDDLWQGLLAGVGPAGSFAVALDPDRRDLLRDELFRTFGAPTGGFSLHAVARCAVARVPE